MTGRGGSGDSIWDYLCLIKMKSGQRNYIMQQPEANHSMYRLTPKFIARNAVNRTLCQATGYSANLYLLPRKKDGRFNHYLLDHSRTLSQSAGATKYQNYTRRGKDEANQKHNTSMGGKIDIKDHTQISTIAWCWHCISHSTGNNWHKKEKKCMEPFTQLRIFPSFLPTGPRVSLMFLWWLLQYSKYTQRQSTQNRRNLRFT